MLSRRDKLLIQPWEDRRFKDHRSKTSTNKTMPRIYKPSRNKNYKKYDAAVIEMALNEYNSSKYSFLDISAKYNIPKSVLHRHNTRIMKRQGGQTALSPAEEEYLLEYINICSEWGYPLEPIDFRLLVKGYLDKMGIEIKKFQNNMPGPDFMSSFIKRHKDKISKRLSQNIKRARAAVSPETIQEYFEELEKSLEGIPPSNIVNYDETNLSDDPGRKRVLVKRTVKYPERVMNHTKGCTSLMIAAAADGCLLPPYVIYKAQNMYDTWRQNGPKGCRYNTTVSGWFDGNTFQDWVKTIAIPYFSDKSGSKILIGDNLASHLSIDLIKECQESNIKFIFLPANSTHLTQPLDVAFFRPLKCAWRDVLFEWKKTDGRTQATIPKNLFPSLLKKLLKKIECNVSKNVLAGFDKCGIYPINKHKVLDRLPSYTPEVTGFKETIDETVLAMLKEMRYGTAHTRRCTKKKKLDVVAGRSVENIEDEESDEHHLQGTIDSGVERITNDNQDIFKAGSSKQNIENREKTDKTVEEIKIVPTFNQKTERGLKTTNKSLIKKTKTKKQTKNDIETDNTTFDCNNFNIMKNSQIKNIENMDITNIDLDVMPMIFEDFLSIPNEVEVITTPAKAPTYEPFGKNMEENTPKKNNKIKIISNEIVNLKPKIDISKVRKDGYKAYYILKKWYKVKSALPAIDDRAPAARPHVTLKLKKHQRELDRKHKVQSDNFSLLQRLNAIMKVNRLDNHWTKPLPNFQHKVGLFYDVESLNSKITARSLVADETEESYSNVKCYACEIRKKQYDCGAYKKRLQQDSLPSIN